MANHPGASLSPDDMRVDPHAEGQRELFRSILARLPDAVLILDREWRLVFANDEARRPNSIRPEDLNGRTHWELYPETLGTEVEHVSRHCMQTGEQGHVEHFYERFD